MAASSLSTDNDEEGIIEPCSRTRVTMRRNIATNENANADRESAQPLIEGASRAAGWLTDWPYSINKEIGCLRLRVLVCLFGLLI